MSETKHKILRVRSERSMSDGYVSTVWRVRCICRWTETDQNYSAAMTKGNRHVEEAT